MILIGEGSVIIKNQYKDIVSIGNEIDFLDEKTQNICESGYMLKMGLNTQEVGVVPKKLIKQGFFEKFFHFF